jgi:ABC-type transporter Mla subunit MlaD
VTASAAAERGDDIERNFERLPTFLRQLKPTTEAFAGLADQMTPALNSLGSQAPAINATIERFGPFSAAATPALVSLGNFGDEARELFPEIRPLIGQLNELAKLFESVDDTGGVEELMKLIYYYTGTTNGVDENGHYVRATLRARSCPTRSTGRAGCANDFENYQPLSSSAASAGEPMLDYLLGSDGDRQ